MGVAVPTVVDRQRTNIKRIDRVISCIIRNDVAVTRGKRARSQAGHLNSKRCGCQCVGQSRH